MLYSIGGGDGTITGIEDIPFATPEKQQKLIAVTASSTSTQTLTVPSTSMTLPDVPYASLEAREGMNEVHGLDSGIYLLEGQKVVIGR